MSTMEIVIAIASAIGAAEVLRIIITKYFSKKQDKITEQKDEFSALRERLDYNEKELNRINENQIKSNRKITKLYNFITGLSKDTCSKKNCAYRQLISIDFDDLDGEVNDSVVTDADMQ